ncbi:hypothetical protein D3C74_35180 [compost metagenome]
MPKMFIYGSCLTRDTKNFFPDDWKATTYIARQSLISASSGVTEVSGKSKLTSAFQNRMIQHDIEGAAFEILEESLKDHDLLLLDFVDERRGVFEVGAGKYVTRSYEMINSGLMKQQKETPRWVDFGTEEHFRLWCAAFDAMMDLIKHKNVPVMAVVPPWAMVNDEGKELVYKENPVSAVNASYERYNRYVVQNGVATVSVSQDTAVAATNHQWGPATFHFVDHVYEELAEKILEFYHNG